LNSSCCACCFSRAAIVSFWLTTEFSLPSMVTVSVTIGSPRFSVDSSRSFAGLRAGAPLLEVLHAVPAAEPAASLTVHFASAGL
jgi:hypothetical protein